MRIYCLLVRYSAYENGIDADTRLIVDGQIVLFPAVVLTSVTFLIVRLYMSLDDQKCQSNSGYQGGNSHEGEAFVFVDVQNDDLACDGDQGHFQDNLDVNNIGEQVCLDGFQQFDADQYQQEESENFQQLINLEDDDGWRDDVPYDNPAQLDGSKNYHNDHHCDKAQHDDVFEFFEKCLHVMFNYRRRFRLSREIIWSAKFGLGDFDFDALPVPGVLFPSTTDYSRYGH